MGNQLPSKRGTAVPTFWPMPVVAKRSPISATAELLSKKDLTSAHLLLFTVCYSGMASLVIRWEVTQVFHIIVHSVMELVLDLTNCQLNV